MNDLISRKLSHSRMRGLLILEGLGISGFQIKGRRFGADLRVFGAPLPTPQRSVGGWLALAGERVLRVPCPRLGGGRAFRHAASAPSLEWIDGH